MIHSYFQSINYQWASRIHYHTNMKTVQLLRVQQGFHTLALRPWFPRSLHLYWQRSRGNTSSYLSLALELISFTTTKCLVSTMNDLMFSIVVFPRSEICLIVSSPQSSRIFLFCFTYISQTLDNLPLCPLKFMVHS